VKLQIFGKGAPRATKASINFPTRPGKPATDDAVPTEEQAMDHASKLKDQRGVPEEVGGEMTPAPVVAAPRRPVDRHASRTLASPIPAMLAETMDLAEEHEPAPQPAQAPLPRR
jgi:hypothetical protein